jgi:predicted nucleotidyltransferase
VRPLSTPATLDHRLCRDPRHDTAIRDLLTRCVGLLTDRLAAQDVVGIVLTGSFARGEGTVLAVNGHLKVLGDIELFVVLRRFARKARRALAALARQASAALGGDRLRVELEFGPIELDYLRYRARPSIFVHDLARHGKVLWGPSDLLDSLQAVAAAPIPREDALFLVFNRTIEQLEAYDRLRGVADDELLDVAYLRPKLLLDLAGSLLAFRGVHAPLYGERPAAFARAVAATPALGRVLPAEFQADLERAARLKLSPAGPELLPPLAGAAEGRAFMRQALVGLVPAVSAVLRWELESLLGRAGDLPVLLDRFLAAQPLARRARDWAKLVSHPIRPPLPLDPLRIARLFWRGTPRALLYVAGALAHRALGTEGPVSDDIAALLPARREAVPRRPEAQRAAIVALWRWCIRND